MGQKQMALKISSKKMAAIHTHLYFKWQTGVFEGKGKIKDSLCPGQTERVQECCALVTNQCLVRIRELFFLLERIKTRRLLLF